MNNAPDKARRIDQLLSSYGYCTRSEARQWVRARRVTVDGAAVASTDDKARVSAVRVDGQPVEFPQGLLVLFYKPEGCICTHESREGKTIYDLLPARWTKRNPPATSVGRLDRDTTGVLLVTDDGALVQRWTSPRQKVPKVYEATVDGVLRPEWIPLFASGTLLLEGEPEPCRPARLEILSPHEARLELVEGRYHQVKRMFASQGVNVTRLHRSRFGAFDLTGLKPGEWRPVSADGLAAAAPSASGAASIPE